MGTPHQGGNGVQLGKLLVNVASVFVAADDRLIQHLKQDSEWLQQQLGQYGPISGDFVTKFAFEEYETPTMLGHSLMVRLSSSRCGSCSQYRSFREHQRLSQAQPTPSRLPSMRTILTWSGSNPSEIADTRLCQDTCKSWSGVQVTLLRLDGKKREGWMRVGSFNYTRDSMVPIMTLQCLARIHGEGNFSVGFSLAEVSETEHFVARRQELAEMHAYLCSEDSHDGRRTVVLHGLGGIGKTQLAVAYAKQHKADYSAVFWLNIKDENAVKQSYAQMANRIRQHCTAASQLNSITETSGVDGVVAAVKQWLDHPKNTRWLMVFDNYDNPKLANTPNPSAVDIRQFLPSAYQGSIIVTTRTSQVAIGHRIKVRKLEDVRDSLQILCDASRRKDALYGKLY